MLPERSLIHHSFVHLADFSQMSYAVGGGGGDYYANAGNYGQQEEPAHHIPMRSPSAGSLNRAPMAPLDSYRGGSIIGHPYASRPHTIPRGEHHG